MCTAKNYPYPHPRRALLLFLFPFQGVPNPPPPPHTHTHTHTPLGISFIFTLVWGTLWKEYFCKKKVVALHSYAEDKKKTTEQAVKKQNTFSLP